jgi:hypothetical protein
MNAPRRTRSLTLVWAAASLAVPIALSLLIGVRNEAPREVAESLAALPSSATATESMPSIDQTVNPAEDRIPELVDRVQSMLNQAPVGEHPELGPFDSLQQLEQHIGGLCRFGMSSEEFVRRCLEWDRTGAPIESFFNPQGRNLSADAAAAVEQAIVEQDRIVEQTARQAYELLEYFTSRYASSGLARVSAATEVRAHPRSDASRYSAYTHVTVGQWKYIVDFRSIDYPDLEIALEAVSQAKRARLEAARQIVARFK